MPPFWLSIIAKAHIFLSLIAAGWVAVDIFVVGLLRCNNPRDGANLGHLRAAH